MTKAQAKKAPPVPLGWQQSAIVAKVEEVPEPIRTPESGVARRPKLATKAEALAMDKQADQIIDGLNSGWLNLGLLMKRMIDTQAFKPLGFANMNEWMRKKLGTEGNSLSKAFSALRSVRALSGVPEEKLKQIGTSNALALTKLPEIERRSEEWLDKAIVTPHKQFKETVAASLEKRGVSREEERRTFSLNCPLSVYEELMAAQAKLARLLGLDIEANPGLRVVVWSRNATMINTTEDEHIIVEMQGGD